MGGSVRAGEGAWRGAVGEGVWQRMEGSVARSLPPRLGVSDASGGRVVPGEGMSVLSGCMGELLGEAPWGVCLLLTRGDLAPGCVTSGPVREAA